MVQGERRKNQANKETKSEKDRRDLVRTLLFDGIWFVLDLWFVWPVSHVWAVSLGAAVILIHLATSSWRVKTRLISCLAVLACTLIAIYFLPPNETEIHGWLTPDNVPIPRENVCAGYIPNDAIAVLLGDEGAFTEENRLLIFTFCQHDILWIKRSARTISINADIFSGRIVAEIRDNMFYLNQNNMFRMERPDRHRLVVYDQEERECLNVHFLNPRAVRITGRLELPDCPCQVQVSNTGIFDNKGTSGIQGICFHILHGDTAGYFGCPR